MREIVETDVLAGRTYDERRIMSDYLEKWMVRSTKSHGRASVGQPDCRDLYLRLLQQVAARYPHHRQIDRRDFFSIGVDDRVAVEYQGQQLAFPVIDILDRSGLKISDPRARGVARYRFEPIWIHRLLVEMHNERCRKAANGNGRKAS